MAAAADAKFYRIKAAQRDLIAMVGGVERAGEMTNYGKSTTGRWNDPNDPTLMPLPAVWLMEAECGTPLVTSALAAVNGRRLAEPDEATIQNGDLLMAHADAVGRAAEMMSAGALAFSDNRLTPAEAAEMDGALSRLVRSAEDYRKLLAGVRANGGLSVVAGEKTA